MIDIINKCKSNLRYYKIDEEEFLFNENDFEINGELKQGITKKDFVKKIGSKEFFKISRYVINSIKTMLKSKHDSCWQSKRAPAYKYSKLALDYLSFLSFLSILSILNLPNLLSIPNLPNFPSFLLSC